MTISKCLKKAGGSVWESNPPSRVLAPITGFEVQAAHQHRYASKLFSITCKEGRAVVLLPVVKNDGTFSARRSKTAARRPFMARCQVRITECHSNVLVSHQFFHGRQVYSPHHEARGKRMSQVMKRAIETSGAPHRCTKGHRDIPVGLVLTGAKRRCGRNGVNPTGLQRVCQYRSHGPRCALPHVWRRPLRQ